MKHHIHTVVVSYNRLELTKQALHSYLETVTLPYSLIVVDNASDLETVDWLIGGELGGRWGLLRLDQNRFPGLATNRGWELMPEQTTLLHRADNDFLFLPGWCEEVVARFKNKNVGQVGLRTAKEELKNSHNVGGNNVIRRSLWEKGLRYDERPWGEGYPPGYTEDSMFSPAVVKMGYEWTRVRKPCIVSLAREDPEDDYYIQSWAIRGIKAPDA